MEAATLKTCIKLTGPEDLPPVPAIEEPLGRKTEKSYPTPPPYFIIRAAFLTASNIEARESSIGTTKQADNMLCLVRKLNICL